MSILAENKWGIQLVEYIKVNEEDLISSGYAPITGAFAVIKVKDKYLIGYNKWRGNFEFPAGKIEVNESLKDAAIRELYEETHQKVNNLIWKGLFKVYDKNKEEYRYRALYYGEIMELEVFEVTNEDEMDRIHLWDMKETIGYVDEVDVKMVELSCM